MTTYTENVKLWLDQSEPDYYMFFLRAWIPFNAWYVNAYPSLEKKDSKIIKELQDGASSKPKEIIKNFLENVDHRSLQFQSYFALLHAELDAITVTHNDKRLSFRELSLTENPLKYNPSKDEKGNVYKAENTTSYYWAYIEEKGGKVLLDFKQPKFILSELTKDNSYIRLDIKVQKKIYKLFEEIDPKKPTSVISKSTNKKDYILLTANSSCKIIKNTETVSKGCIAVLYALRCMLFHGEIAPTERNKKIYENAYYLLQLIIKELK